MFITAKMLLFILSIKKFFEKYGTVLGARIVTKWNGRSKGCAYVDFEQESAAAAALVGADGAEIRGEHYQRHTIDDKVLQTSIEINLFYLGISKISLKILSDLYFFL